MIKVNDTVTVLDENHQHYRRNVSSRGRVVAVHGDQVQVRMFLPRSPEYFPLTFTADRVKIVN
jgi:hypothetical protein